MSYCVDMCRDQKLLRVVVREDLSYEMASDLVNDMNQVIEWLDHHFIYSGMLVTHHVQALYQFETAGAVHEIWRAA